MAIDMVKGMQAYGATKALDVHALANAASMLGQASGTQGAEGGDFMGLLRDTVSDATRSLSTNETMNKQALVQKSPLQDVVLSVNEAEMTLRTVVAIRDRVIAAYQDIIKMPI